MPTALLCDLETFRYWLALYLHEHDEDVAQQYLFSHFLLWLEKELKKQ